jgi:hypothetical protein
MTGMVEAGKDQGRIEINHFFKKGTLITSSISLI